MAMFALRLAPLELIFQGTVEEQTFYEQFKKNGQAPDMILWESALEWQKTIEGYLGQDLADVVLRCVGLRFSVVPDLGKAEFISEVLTCVIEPLEDYIRGSIRPIGDTRSDARSIVLEQHLSAIAVISDRFDWLPI
ncbi:unnamed protein product [Clonostachys rhizophaga]|uniref:Uncharacterized protein n=1 Tax=Clonostachys rhizophaga TaxID=160324 RepID=A0A9N9YMY2_9HYPO|nr:unnamed protein product [Clonostachys rhizophaga]